MKKFLKDSYVHSFAVNPHFSPSLDGAAGRAVLKLLPSRPVGTLAG
jgi:hypothetical protein